MKKYEVIILPLAEHDISRNKQAPETAIRLLHGFYDTIEKLEVLPESHELDEDEELAERGIRKCYYKNYKIFFYVNEEEQEVYVLRVLHMLVNAKPLLLNLEF